MAQRKGQPTVSTPTSGSSLGTVKQTSSTIVNSLPISQTLTLTSTPLRTSLQFTIPPFHSTIPTATRINQTQPQLTSSLFTTYSNQTPQFTHTNSYTMSFAIAETTFNPNVSLPFHSHIPYTSISHPNPLPTFRTPKLELTSLMELIPWSGYFKPNSFLISISNRRKVVWPWFRSI